MRIVILTSPHNVYANYLVKQLLTNQEEYEIVGVIESKVLLPNKKFSEAIMKFLKISGLYFVIMQAIKRWFYRLGSMFYNALSRKDVESNYYTYDKIAKSIGIPIHQTIDINSENSQTVIESLKPDLILILLFGQILKKHIIDLPSRGCINFHPAYLPNYRGLMPVFWAISNNETQGGVTFHFVDTGIDTGPVISRAHVPINEKDTEHSVYARSCVIAKPLLFEIINQIIGGQLSTIDVAKDYKGPYYSLPTFKSIKKYRQAGRKLFTFSSLLKSFEDL